MYKNMKCQSIVAFIFLNTYMAYGLDPAKACSNEKLEEYTTVPTQAYVNNLCLGITPPNNAQECVEYVQQRTIPSYCVADIVRSGINRRMSPQAREAARQAILLLGTHNKYDRTQKRVIPAYAKHHESHYKGKPYKGTGK